MKKLPLGIYKNPNMSFPIDNIFDIPNPEKLHCHVRSVSPSLPTITIAMVEPQKQSYEAYFVGWKFMNAPQEWIGANVQLASAERLISELRTLPRFDQLPDEDLLQWKMYIIQSERREIVIISGSANISKEIALGKYEPNNDTEEFPSVSLA